MKPGYCLDDGCELEAQIGPAAWESVLSRPPIRSRARLWPSCHRRRAQPPHRAAFARRSALLADLSHPGIPLYSPRRDAVGSACSSAWSGSRVKALEVPPTARAAAVHDDGHPRRGGSPMRSAPAHVRVRHAISSPRTCSSRAVAPISQGARLGIAARGTHAAPRTGAMVGTRATSRRAGATCGQIDARGTCSRSVLACVRVL